MNPTLPDATEADAARDALVERLIASAAGALDVVSVYLGDQLGYYAALDAAGPLTAPALAARTGTAERYAREWLEQQAATGFLTVDDPALPAEERRFALPPGHADALARTDDLAFMAPLAQVVVGCLRPVERLAEAYRTGAGVPYTAYGAGFVEGQGRMNRNFFLRQLGPDYLAQIPGLAARLNASGRVADVGCGVGWSSIGLAEAFPGAAVDGFDLDALSVERAQAYVGERGLGSRVRVERRDVADPALAGQYDLVIAVECVHDMADPVGALRTMRRLAAEDGVVLVVDERAADAFTPGADPLERLFYGFSIVHCLPVGLADCTAHACAATGTVMRADTLRAYAQEAGFRDVDVLPLDYDLFRFYQLVG